MNKFHELVSEAVDVHLAVKYQQIPHELRTALAIEHLSQPAIHEDFYDTGEFCSAKSFLDDVFHLVRAGDLAEVGYLFLREMWATSEPAVQDAMDAVIRENEEKAEYEMEKARGNYL